MKSGGPALKQAIHIARERSELTSDIEVARRAGVSYDTLMNWFGNKTTPRPAELRKVADSLGIRYGELMDAWEGRETEPPPLQIAIRELIGEMRLSRAQQDEATVALLRAMASVVRGDRGPTGTPVGNGAGLQRDRSERP